VVPVAAGCAAEPVSVTGATPAHAERPACRQLIAALPERVAGQQQRDVDPADALAAAWGDPAIVLRCGVTRPKRLTRTARCDLVNDVGWFSRRRSDGYVFTTIGRAAYVELSVPAQYEPAGDALVDVAEAVFVAVPEVKPCG
jgi:hypothetical protein